MRWKKSGDVSFWVLCIFSLVLGSCTGKIEGDKEQRSYAVGYALGSQLAAVRDDVDIEFATRGFKDGIRKDPKLEEETLSRRLTELNLKQREREIGTAADNLKASLEFMEKTGAKPGVRLIERGLLVEEVKPGVGLGRSLKDEEEIWLHYVAKLFDGTIIDQTNATEGVQVHFKDLILPGLKTAVQRMPLGAEWIVYLSPEQGYGASSRAGIPSQTALIYDVTLTRVGSKKAPTP